MQEKEESILFEKKKYWINQLEKMRLDANTQFDKQIVYISGGGLVLSIGFVKDIIGVDSTPEFKSLLIIAWICFTFSLITNLFSFKSASYSFDYIMLEDEKLFKRYHRITSILNWSSITGLILGLSFFLDFVVFNF
jgi:hypothetical protein